MSDDPVREWLEGLTYEQLQAVRDLVEREIARRRSDVRPADAVERTGRGRMFLPTTERK